MLLKESVTALSCAGYRPAKIHLILLWFRFVIDNTLMMMMMMMMVMVMMAGLNILCPQKSWIQPGTQGQNMDLLGSCEVPARHLFG